MLGCAAGTRPDACRYMRIIEEWGSGIPRIQKMLADAGLKPLEIIDNGINLQFRIWRPAASGDGGMKGGMKGGTGKANQGNGAANVTTTREKTTEKTREKILLFLSEHPNATQDEIATSTELSVKGVEWNLRALKKANLIRRIGPDKGGHWEVVQ